jgi:hypothetical protein
MNPVEDMQALLKGQTPRRGILSVSSTKPSEIELAEWLRALPRKAEGWLCVTDAVYVLFEGGWSKVAPKRDGADPFEVDTCRRVLAGEFRLSEHNSVHLRRHGEDLIAHHYTAGSAPSSPGVTHDLEVPVLCFDESFVSTERAGPTRLCYVTCWRAMNRGDPPVAVWEPWLSRFAGWRTEP